jgi:SlyX protein
MTDMADHSARIDALEIRIAHQDRQISELNEVITDQWRAVDALKRQIAMLRDELQSLAPGREGPEPPPPHY